MNDTIPAIVPKVPDDLRDQIRRAADRLAVALPEVIAAVREGWEAERAIERFIEEVTATTGVSSLESRDGIAAIVWDLAGVDALDIHRARLWSLGSAIDRPTWPDDLPTTTRTEEA